MEDNMEFRAGLVSLRAESPNIQITVWAKRDRGHEGLSAKLSKKQIKQLIAGLNAAESLI